VKGLEHLQMLMLFCDSRNDDNDESQIKDGEAVLNTTNLSHNGRQMEVFFSPGILYSLAV
jgi:hypothetical protein